jgi:hypothetical protein
MWIETELSDGIEMARSTFNRHKEAIQEIFGINIECDTRDGYKYYITNEEDLRDGCVQNWMLSSLTTSNILLDSLSLRDRIITEPVYLGNDFLQSLLFAMKSNLKIDIHYQKYGAETPRELKINPYAVKMYHQRWYIVGVQEFPPKGEHTEWLRYIGTFSFDRIKDLNVTEEKFTMIPGFDVRQYFDDCFSIVHGDGSNPCRIVIRAYGSERYYMKDLPWHHSQREIECGDNWTDFEFYMRPSLDFSNHIMSRGALVKVIEPEWLVEEVYNMLLDAAQQYHPEDFTYKGNNSN